MAHSLIAIAGPAAGETERAPKTLSGESNVKRAILWSIGIGSWVLLGAGCGHEPTRDSTAAPKPAQEKTIVSHADPVPMLASMEPKKRARFLRDRAKDPPQTRQEFAAAAEDYVQDPDPDVAAAAKELIQSARSGK
jgi:hypothetical protein